MTHRSGQSPKSFWTTPLGIVVAVVLTMAILVILLGAGQMFFNSLNFQSPYPAPTAPATVHKRAALPEPVVVNSPRTAINDGTWTVGVDLVPGTYRVVGAGKDCYWEINNTGDNGKDIVANHLGGGNLNVTLQPGQDFTTNWCGIWTRE